MATRNSSGPGKRSVLDGIHDIAANLAGGVLIVITLIVLAGIGSRLFLGQPIPASNELIGSCLMVALTYLALSSAHHIRITVFTRKLPEKALAWTERAVIVVSLAGLAVAAWAAAAMAVTSLRTGESTVGLYTFDIAPFRLLICAGLLLLLLRIAREGRTWLKEETSEEEVARAGGIPDTDPADPALPPDAPRGEGGTTPRSAGDGSRTTTSDATRDA